MAHGKNQPAGEEGQEPLPYIEMSPGGPSKPESVCAEVKRGKPGREEEKKVLVNRGSGPTMQEF